MKKLKEYKTLGCHFTVYDEGIELHKMTSSRFIRKEDIADVTIKKFTSKVTFRIANTKEEVTLMFTIKNIQNREYVRVGEFLQGKIGEDEYMPSTLNNKEDILPVDEKLVPSNKGDEEFSIPQLVVGLIIIACAGLFIWGVFSEDEVVSPTLENTIVSEEIKNEQSTVEPLVQIVTLYDVPMSKLSEQFNTPLNSAGNLVVEDTGYDLLVESKNGVTSDYVELQLKTLGSCSKPGVSRNSDQALELVGLKPHLKGRPTNPPAGVANGAIEYCDYPSEKFSVGTSCMYDGGYYDVSLSPRTYCGD